MAITVWSFTANEVSIIHGANASIVVQIQEQQHTPWLDSSSYWKLKEVSWETDATTTVVHGDFFPFNAAEIVNGHDTAIGEMASTSFSLEGTNKTFDSSGNRLSDTLTFNPSLSGLLCRIGWSTNPAIESYAWAVGVIDYNSIDYKMEDLNNKDSWIVSFDVKDTLSLLENHSVSSWIDNIIYNDFELPVRSSNIYASYVGPASYGKWNHIGKGRVRVGGVARYIKDTGDINGRLNSTDSDKGNKPTGGNEGWSHTEQIRFIKVTDIFQSIHDMLGLEGTINNGLTWPTNVTSKYLYNESNYTGSDTITLNTNYFDDLYIPFGTSYDSTKSHPDKNNNWTMFSEDGNHNPSDFRAFGSMIDVIKYLSSTFGLRIGIEMTSNSRYLNVEDVTKSFPSLTGMLVSSYSYINNDISFQPYQEIIDGITVVSPFNKKYLLGGKGNNPLAFDCGLSFGHQIVRSHTETNSQDATQGYGYVDKSKTPYEIWIDWGDKEFWHTPFICNETPVDDVNGIPHVNEMHTVSLVVPRRNKVELTQTDEGSGGKYYSILGGETIDGVGFPSDVSNSSKEAYCEQENVWQRAMAQLYYTNLSYDINTVSLNRRGKRVLNIRYGKMVWPDIGQDVIISMGGEDIMWRVLSRTFNLRDFTTTLELLLLEYKI